MNYNSKMSALDKSLKLSLLYALLCTLWTNS